MSARMAMRAWFAFIAALVLPSVALAHEGGGHAHGFLAGLSHPLSGFDHLVAAAAVGIWGGSLRGRASWLLPASFVLATGIGIFAGAGIASSMVETAIALSVVGLGIFLALDTRLDVRIAAVLIACAGLAHGAAHAAEADPALPAFAAGALVTTAILHALGVLVAIIARSSFAIPLRAAGAVMALFGLSLISAAPSA